MRLLQKNLLLLLFASLFAIFGCDKEDVEPKCKNQCTTIKGRLVTNGGNAPIAKTVVKVDFAYPSMFGSGSYRIKAKTKTDKNGYYELSFYATDEELIPNSSGYFGIKYEVDGNKYLDTDNQVGSVVGHIPFDFKRDTTYEMPDFLVPKKAFIRLNCSNYSQINAQNGDKFGIEFSTKLGVQKTNGTFYTDYTTFLNFNSGMENILTFAGEQNVYVTTTKTKNGITTTETETIIIPEGTTHEIVKEF